MGSRLPAQDNTICATCGKSFHVKPSVLSKGKGKFCSRDCIRYLKGAEHPLHGRRRSEGVERACSGCGKTFRHRRPRVRYCSVACHHKANPRKPTAGHRGITAQGYVRLTLPDGSRVLEHRWVWEQANGPIPDGALVHHRNEVKTDNRLENLMLVASVAAHNAEHGGSLRLGKYQRNVSTCHPDRPHKALGLCRPCYVRHRRGTLVA